MSQLDIQIKARIRKILPSMIIAANVLLTIGFYALMPKIVDSLKVDLVHARSLPNRDNNWFFLTRTSADARMTEGSERRFCGLSKKFGII